LLLKPRPRRFPERKAVTIAIALLASDGIVLAADREEGDGYLKTDQGKISFKLRLTLPIGASAVTGAGSGPYLDEIAAILNDMVTDDSEGTEDSIGPKILNTHRTYYKETVIPFSSYPYEQRPDYELLVACFGDKIKSVWSTHQLAMTKVRDYESVGVGAKVANTWFQRLYDRVPCTHAAKLAAYVVFQTKRSVRDVGGDTDVLVLRRANPMPQYVPSAVLRDWENAFRFYASLERNVFYYCIGLETKEELLYRTKLGKDAISKSLDNMRNALTQSDEKKSEDSQ
jgi:20S proteasome alpha/beta subunit